MWCNNTNSVVQCEAIKNESNKKIVQQWRSWRKKEIDSLLERKIIRYSDSPYGSPALLVPKGSYGNKYRLVIDDYKLVNKQTTDSYYPLPFLHSFSDVLYGKTVFSKLDLQANLDNLNIQDFRLVCPALHGRFPDS